MLPSDSCLRALYSPGAIALVASVTIGMIAVETLDAQEKKLRPLKHSDSSTDSTAPLADDTLADPSVQEAIKEAVKEALETRKLQAEAEMKAILTELQEDYEVEGEALTALELAAEKSVEASLEPWTKDFEEFLTLQFRRMVNRYAYDKLVVLQQLKQSNNTAERYRSTAESLPRSQEVWKKALAASPLSEADRKKWEKSFLDAEKERKESLEETLEELITTTRQTQLTEAEPLMKDVLKISKADDTQRERFRVLINEIIEGELKSWKEDTTFVLERVQDNRWNSFARMATPREVDRSDLWKSGIEGILAADQMEAWNAEVERKRNELEEKLDTLLSAEVSKQRSEFDPRMNRELEQLIEIVEPDAATRKELEKAAEAAVEQSADSWKASAKTLFFRLPLATRNSVLERNQFRYRPSMEGVQPEEQEAWKSAVETLLTPEQTITWQAELAKRKEDNAKRLADMVDATAESYRMQFEAVLDPRISDVIGSLALDEKRAKAFKKAGESAIDQSLDSWKKNAREWLDGLTDSQRDEYTRQGRVPLGYNSNDAAENQPAWKNAFTKILTEEERERWDALLKERKTKQEGAAAGIMLSFIEEWVGLHPEQWEPILKIFRKHSEPVHSQFKEQHYYMNTSQVAQAIKAVEESELKKILNESQWSRWQKAAEIVATQGRSQRMEPPANLEKPRPGPDLLYIEDAITRLIYERNRKMKDEMLMVMLAEIETGSKAAKIPTQSVGELRTAAKGAVEEVVNQWDGNFVRYARGRVQGATPKTIYQQLGSVGNYSSRNADPKETPLWKKNLSLVLNEDQKKRWDAIHRKREDFRQSAVLDLVVVYFEGTLGIGSEQSEEFRQLLVESLEKYGPDIERYFSSHSSPWYFRYYSVGLPLMGIPEKKWKGLLSEEQMKTWEQQYQPNAANYWDNIQRYHKDRMEAEKKEAKEDS